MKWLLCSVGFVSILAAVLFVSAGRLDLPWFWAFTAVHGVLVAVEQASLGEDLRRERSSPGPGGRDRNLRRISMPFYLAHLVVAGLDVGRLHWSGPLPAAVQGVGLALYSSGLGLAVWAMSANRFFSTVARAQHERGHVLISSSPYRYIRHPGYAGGLLAMVGSGIALGSWWSLLPLLPVALLTARRTVIEDRLLHSDLAGYRLYATRVRRRLVPGVW